MNPDSNEDLKLFEKAEALREAERTAQAQARVDSWRRNMNKAFKGIVPRPIREDLLRKAVAKAEKEGRL